MVLEICQLPDGKGFGPGSYTGLIFVTVLTWTVKSRPASACVLEEKQQQPQRSVGTAATVPEDPAALAMYQVQATLPDSRYLTKHSKHGFYLHPGVIDKKAVY